MYTYVVSTVLFFSWLSLPVAARADDEAGALLTTVREGNKGVGSHCFAKQPG